MNQHTETPCEPAAPIADFDSQEDREVVEPTAIADGLYLIPAHVRFVVIGSLRCDLLADITLGNVDPEPIPELQLAIAKSPAEIALLISSDGRPLGARRTQLPEADAELRRADCGGCYIYHVGPGIRFIQLVTAERATALLVESFIPDDLRGYIPAAAGGC